MRAGDVTGDGLSDLACVGASLTSVFFGSTTQPFLMWWEASEDDFDADLELAQAAGDVNGDGFGDLLLAGSRYSGGHSEEGRVALYAGDGDGPAEMPAWQATGGADGFWLGVGLAAGDLDGDGFDDLVVGAPGYSNTAEDEGAVLVFLSDGSSPDSSPSRVLEGGVDGALFGSSVTVPGDLNNDGFDDLVVAAHGGGIAGRVFLHLGGPGGLDALPVWSYAGLKSPKLVSPAGDVNGDGYPDLVVADPESASISVFLACLDADEDGAPDDSACQEQTGDDDDVAPDDDDSAANDDDSASDDDDDFAPDDDDSAGSLPSCTCSGSKATGSPSVVGLLVVLGIWIRRRSPEAGMRAPLQRREADPVDSFGGSERVFGVT